MSSGVFDEVAQRGSIPKVEERILHQKIVGQEGIVESTTWGVIKEGRVGLLGVYGTGGVGKTTFLSQINNKFLTERNAFDVVIWVVVSRNPTVKRIQEDIGKRLELYEECWERKTENEIAFTTRSNEVCGSMGVDEELEVKVLMWHDAWDLFTRNMEETLKRHRDIPKIAQMIARKCACSHCHRRGHGSQELDRRVACCASCFVFLCC